MNQRISRRDILHGVGAIAASSFVPGHAFAREMLAAETAGTYPPALTGMRGNHPGSFDVAHQLAREGKTDWGPFSHPDPGIYDLVVVGAGISGLAAAHFYRKAHPDARILILDNHDDFGGHAKRNEFEIGGQTVIGYGGAQTMEEPYDYSRSTKTLLRDLGVELSKFETAYDYDFYERNGLAAGVFFDRENWGVDRLIYSDLGSLRSYIPFAPSKLSVADAVDEMPMSDAAKVEMLRLLTVDEDCIPEISLHEKEDYLYNISYRDFLRKHIGITEPEVFAAMQRLSTDSSLGIELASAGTSFLYVGLPGFRATGIPGIEEGEPYIHHFPDGNASIARLLVRAMIPHVAPGSTMDDIVTARFNYDELDLPDAPVRLRLDSTVVNVSNMGSAESLETVSISYVQNGEAAQVRAKHCVLACYNAMIPSICPDLPAEQREALAWQVKTPMLYTTVALNNWRAWKNLGIGGVVAPGGYHVNALLDFPVSIGGYQFGETPNDPVLVHMERFYFRADSGLSQREQHRLGRYDLYATPFEDIERSVRQQLAAMLSVGGFDAADDISGITVNRWAHGYAYGYSDLEDEFYDSWDDERYPHVRARKPFGRITIANSDAGASATMNSAVSQAWRAIQELE